MTLKYTAKGIKRVAEEEVVRPPKKIKRFTKRASKKVKHSKKRGCETCLHNLSGAWKAYTGLPCCPNSTHL